MIREPASFLGALLPRGLPMVMACLLTWASLLATWAADTDTGAEKDLPRVLILGDSISIAYTPLVRDLLKGEARVSRPMRDETHPENCEGTLKGVRAVKRWLQIDGGHWDVIHFNFGLHDLKRIDPATGQASKNPRHPRQSSLEVYRERLEDIVAQLKATQARLIFATTTPVPEGNVKPHRDVADPARYNAAAVAVMKKHGVAVNDLYAFALPRLSEIQQPVNVHFTKAGSEALAREVAEHIRRDLRKN